MAAVVFACVSIFYFSIRMEKTHTISHLIQELGSNAFQVSYLEVQIMRNTALEAQAGQPGKSSEGFLADRKRSLEKSREIAKTLTSLLHAPEATRVEDLIETLNQHTEQFDQNISKDYSVQIGSSDARTSAKHPRNLEESGVERGKSLQNVANLQSRISDINQLASLLDTQTHQQVMLAAALWLLLLLTLSIFFLRFTARSLVKPINELARYIIQLGAGDLDSRPLSSSNSPEFAYLTETLDSMAKNLKKTMVSRLELSKSQALLETILLGITDGIISTDMEGKVLYMNKQTSLLFDGPESSHIGKSYFELVTSYDFFEEDGSPIPKDQMAIPQALKGVSQLPRLLRRRKNGGNPENDSWVISQAISLCDEHAKISVVVLVIRDITEQKKNDLLMAQQKIQLELSARLSSVGEMAAGIAHEINNPLAVIQRRAEQIIENLDDGKIDPTQIRNYSEKIVSFSKRISKIIRSLKSLSRDGEHDSFEAVPIRTLVDDSLELCREKFRNHEVALLLELPEEMQVECRTTQISQVLLNLINNAFDAVTSLAGTAEKWVKVSASMENGDVLIRVADSGPGIPLELRQKIGIPFFTTKEAGKGTGLGISVSRRIMHLHHGTLKLDDSNPFTCFVLRLPEKQPREKERAA